MCVCVCLSVSLCVRVSPFASLSLNLSRPLSFCTCSYLAVLDEGEVGLLELLKDVQQLRGFGKVQLGLQEGTGV